MREKKRLYRVVTFLGREGLDFLDDLAKDLYFLYGVKVPRAKLIKQIIGEFREQGIQSKKQLMDKMLYAAGQKVDRRQYPRLSKHLLVGLRRLDSLEEYKSGFSENIGMGGFKINVPALDESLSVNQVVEFTLKSAEEKAEPIKAIGRVVWIKEKTNKHGLELGVRLTYIKKEDRERFNRYLGMEEDAKAKFK